ncbi:hypothetical protein ACWA1C_00290 [Flectobacillus roseus]
MAKKLSKIQEEIEASALSFKSYLERALDGEILSLFQQFCREGEVFLFSGVIRNFFLKTYLVRDLDIVINGDVNVEKLLENYTYKKNSFGGYKVTIAGKNIDIWFLKNTWALNYQINLNYELEKFIPLTSFFNFSSIVYDFNKSEFYVSTHFCRFLRDKRIDLVFAPNANLPLCLINSIYYSKRLKMPIAKKLSGHLTNIYNRLKKNNISFDESQIKHFGKVLYTKEEIEEWMQNLNTTVKKNQKKNQNLSNNDNIDFCE